MTKSSFRENLEKFIEVETQCKNKIDNEIKYADGVSKENLKIWKKDAYDFDVQERKIITEQTEKEVECYKSSEKVELKIKKEIENLDNEFNNNKKACVEYLVDKILEVDLTIPDVVLGLFSARFNQ